MNQELSLGKLLSSEQEKDFVNAQSIKSVLEEFE